MKKSKFIWITGLTAVVMLRGVVQAADSPENLTGLQNDAVNLYQEGHYDAPIPLYRKLAKAHPKSKGALKDLLLTLWLGEHYREAADVGEQLTDLSQNDVEAEFIYARALLAIGQKESAMAAFQRCRELDPNEQHIQLAAARVEAMLRDYTTAMAHMESLKNAHPDYREIYPELARVQQVTGDYAGATDNWAAAVKYFPDNRTFAFHFAECQYYSGQREAALHQLRALTAGKAAYWPAIDFQTDIALANGDTGGARSILESH